MSVPVILDAGGLAALASTPSPRFRAILAEALRRGSEVLVPAVVCAEICRGAPRTRSVEAVLGRHRKGTESFPAVKVVPTDFRLARMVGNILHGASADTTDMVDAHSIALCVRAGGGLVITDDSSDLLRLAAAVPAVRISVRPPS